MLSGSTAIKSYSPESAVWHCCLRLMGLVAVCVGLLACSGNPTGSHAVGDLAPLQLEGRSVTVAEVAVRAPTPDLLALDPVMRDFVQRYTSGVHSSRQRLMMLHRAVIGAGALNLQYDPLAEGSAREVFHRASANCLSYANMFIALAREAGLDASYQWLEVRPQWTLLGERVMVRRHVNVLVDLGRGGQYMVDIDPMPTRDIAGTRQISDADAQALHHSNIAMEALASEELELAWLQAVRALQLSPKTSHLWVNLGAIYRLAGQHREAESSYLHALQLAPRDRSAMNNLVVLYGIEDRHEERAFWEERVAQYRDTNPYYHAWLGDQAADSGDWQRALQHYQSARSLLPQDNRLLYATGQIHYRMQDLAGASHYLRRAIKAATLRSDIERYQRQLDEVEQRQLAAI